MRTPSFWHRPSAEGILLAPASILYLIGARLVRKLAKPQRAPVPVISVGNVTAGGAGKTPATIALTSLLSSLGETPHILTRGYGGRNAQPRQVMKGGDWKEVGDEPLLLAAHAPCWVGKERIRSAALAAEAGASVLLADDALQHHALKKDISLLVIDGTYGLGNGMPLPAGPLREPLADALARCHAILLIGEDKRKITANRGVPVFTAQLMPEGDVSYLKEGQWLAFAGLARPEKFFNTLKEHGATVVKTHCFADHHPYTEKDLEALFDQARTLNAKLITTEKDAVKIPPEWREKLAVLRVVLTFDGVDGLSAWLKEQLIKARA